MSTKTAEPSTDLTTIPPANDHEAVQALVATNVTVEDLAQEAFRASRADLKTLQDKYHELAITDLEDKEQVKAVETAHKEVKAFRVSIGKVKADRNTIPLAWQRANNAEAEKWITEAKALEERLAAERAKIDEHKKKKKEAKEKELIALQQKRVDQLTELQYPIPELIQLRVMSDEQFERDHLVPARAMKKQREEEAAAAARVESWQAKFEEAGCRIGSQDARNWSDEELQGHLDNAVKAKAEKEAEAKRQQEQMEEQQRQLEAQRKELEELKEQQRLAQEQIEQAKEAERRKEEEARQAEEAARLKAQAEQEAAERAKNEAEAEAKAKKEAEEAAERLRPHRELIAHLANQISTFEIPNGLIKDHEPALRLILEDCGDTILQYAENLK